MNIDYVARNLELDSKIREFTADKLQKVGKFLDDPVDGRAQQPKQDPQGEADGERAERAAGRDSGDLEVEGRHRQSDRPRCTAILDPDIERTERHTVDGDRRSPLGRGSVDRWPGSAGTARAVQGARSCG